MKKLTLAGMLAAIALAGPALAADLRPAPPLAYKAPVIVPLYNWSGFYVGVNAGGSWGRDSTDYDIAGFPLFSTSQNLNGFIGGGQIGWNWQTGPWVWGVEADFQGTSQKGDIVTPLLGGATNDYDQKMPWLGTVRGRVGFTPADRWLIYATGGFAYANLKTTDTLTVPGVGVGSVSFSDDLAGWTVGGGVEWALWGAWTAKVEYLYVNLSSATDSGTALLPGVPAFTATNHVTDNIFRAGLNWRFGGGPVVAGF